MHLPPMFEHLNLGLNLIKILLLLLDHIQLLNVSMYFPPMFEYLYLAVNLIKVLLLLYGLQ